MSGRNEPQNVCPKLGTHQYKATGKEVTEGPLKYAIEKCSGCGAERRVPVTSVTAQPPREPGGPQPIGK